MQLWTYRQLLEAIHERAAYAAESPIDALEVAATLGIPEVEARSAVAFYERLGYLRSHPAPQEIAVRFTRAGDDFVCADLRFRHGRYSEFLQHGGWAQAGVGTATAA